MFTSISSRTQHVRRFHTEEDIDLTEDTAEPTTNRNQHVPTPQSDPLSSPQKVHSEDISMESDTSSSSPAKHLHTMLDILQPFDFKWDSDEGSIYNDDSNSDESQYDYDSDAKDDNDEDWLKYATFGQFSSPKVNHEPHTSPTGSYRGGYWQYEEWDQYEGWGPMDDDDQQYESGRDSPEQLAPQRSRSQDPRDQETRREYHEHLNGVLVLLTLSC